MLKKEPQSHAAPFSYFSALLAVCLPNHILHNDIVDFADSIAVFQNLPRLVGVEMDLDEILISSRNETVSLEMLCDIFCDLILIQILVSSVDEQLRIVTVSELIILCIN